MLRFILGIVCGIAVSGIIGGGLPLQWDDDPEKRSIGKSQEKLIITIAHDATLDNHSQCKEYEVGGTQRMIHIFQSKDEAEKCKKRVIEQVIKTK